MKELNIIDPFTQIDEAYTFLEKIEATTTDTKIQNMIRIYLVEKKVWDEPKININEN